MNTVKNLHVNKKAKSLNKKTIYKVLIGAILGTVLIITPLSVINAHNEKQEEKQNASIVAYYGEDSVENKIIKYIEISEKLTKLKLDSFDIDQSLYKKHNISVQLKTIEEIEDYIEKFNGMNSYVSSKDITKQSYYIDIVLNLAIQEKLVNSYIYNVGYSTANQNITSATKNYAAEVFGVENPANVYFNYHSDKSSGQSNTTITDKTPDKNAEYGKKTYNFDNLLETKEEKNINKGVFGMIETDVFSDEIPDDNEKYNGDRNDIIRKVLADSAELERQVNEYDLYNEKKANKMK